MASRAGQSAPAEPLSAEVSTYSRLPLPVVDAPFFPEGTVLVTFLKNLSIYWQEETRRRHLRDEPDYDQIADYQSSNDAYVVEDFGAVSLVENIEAMTYPAPTEA